MAIMKPLTDLLSYLVLFLSILGCQCETPQIANPPPPNPSDIPLYGTTGQPLENDIQQGTTPDCFLEATLAAVVRIQPNTITNMLVDNGDSTVTATFYDSSGKKVAKTAQKKGFEDLLLTDDSMSCWVAIIQETYQKLLDDEKSSDSVYDGKGGTPVGVFRAIYGRSATARDCYNIAEQASNANLDPIVLTTNGTNGELVTDHAYTVHTVNASHITLRNPWGVINENGWGIPTTGGSNIQDLGNGTFNIPISVAQTQCQNLQSPALSKRRKLLFNRDFRISEPPPVNKIVILGMVVTASVMVITILCFALAKQWRRRSLAGGKSEAIVQERE